MSRKTKYLEYDYESVYQEDIEKAAEEKIQEIIKSGRGQVYATKEIHAGDQLELEIYPQFTRQQKNLIPDPARKRRQKLAQKNLNDKNSRKQCERLVNTNFTDRDIWATFSYSDDHMPASMKEARKDISNYIKRLNYRRKKLGLKNTRYIYVIECSKKGRWHHHIVMDGDVSMDLVEELWTLGRRNEVRRLHRDEDGLTGLARYITKPPEQKKGKDEGKGQKRWSASKNLKKPKQKVTHYKIKSKEVREITRNVNVLPDILHKWFPEPEYELTSSNLKYNDFNGRVYIYARMRKILPREKEKKRT